MHNKNPIEAINTDIINVGINRVIDAIKPKISALDWSQYVYGRAITSLKDGFKLPYVYNEKKEYIAVLPNDNAYSQIFFRTNSDETTSFNNTNSRRPISFERGLSLIAWVNLERLPLAESALGYVYTEKLKEDIYSVLQSCSEVSAIERYVDDSFESVFNGYEIITSQRRYIENAKDAGVSTRNELKKLELEKKYALYPFACFRIDFKVKYFYLC